MTNAYEYLKPYGERAKGAVVSLSGSAAQKRNAVLLDLASLIEKNKAEIFAANEKDLKYSKEKNLSSAMQDRLLLNDKRIADIVTGLKQLCGLEEYAGKTESEYTHPDGFVIEKVLVPLGVIGIIYESRPNVTVDAAALCIKSGNVCILRGGSEAIHSNLALAKLARQALKQNGIDENAVQLLDDTAREIANELMKSRQFLDLLIPRGSASLIQAVTKNATVPVIETGAGICHVFVEKTADFEKTLNIIENGKVQKPSVCNAVETVLIQREVAKKFLPLLSERLAKHSVEMRGCAECLAVCPDMKPATDEDWMAEYNDLILSVKVVSDLDEALMHINNFSTKHSDCIVTENKQAAERFLHEVDSAAVYHNVSTRFSDGFEFGMGAEIGISTQKMHARGPMGLRELYTTQYRIRGNGQVRK